MQYEAVLVTITMKYKLKTSAENLKQMFGNFNKIYLKHT